MPNGTCIPTELAFQRNLHSNATCIPTQLAFQRNLHSNATCIPTQLQSYWLDVQRNSHPIGWMRSQRKLKYHPIGWTSNGTTMPLAGRPTVLAFHWMDDVATEVEVPSYWMDVQRYSLPIGWTSNRKRVPL